MLSDRDRSFLAAVRSGESAASYARRNNYSPDWAKFESKRVRRLLGVQTLEEAVRVSDDGVSRADFDALRKLVESTNDALADLAKAATPQQEAQAQSQVRERELDEKEMAKRLGISLDDVKRVRDENEYGKFKSMQERLAKEKADEEAAELAAANGDDTDDRSAGRKVLDGLGGVRNVDR